MNSDQKFWLFFWLIIVCGIVCLAAVIAGGICLNNSIAMKNGYEEVLLPGQTTSSWQKVEQTNPPKNLWKKTQNSDSTPVLEK